MIPTDADLEEDRDLDYAYVSASITGKPIYLAPAEQSITAVEQGLAASATVPDMPERTWDRVRETRSIEALEMFIKQYPGTIYAVLARERIAELQRSLQPAVQSLSVSTKQTSNQVATAGAPEIVIGACSNLLTTKLSKSILVRALNRRGLAESMMALVMVILMGEGIG